MRISDWSSDVCSSDLLSAVLSVSERHNLGNVRRTPMESVLDYHQIVASMPEGTTMRLNVATAFDCPHEGPVAAAEVLDLLEQLIPPKPDIEIALCDTTGRAYPDTVARLFETAVENLTRKRVVQGKRVSVSVN